MGGSISVLNKSGRDINANLGHVGTLHYKNYIKNGECYVFDGIGLVWFTLQVRDSRTDKTEEFTTGQAVTSIGSAVAACVGIAVAFVADLCTTGGVVSSSVLIAKAATLKAAIIAKFGGMAAAMMPQGVGVGTYASAATPAVSAFKGVIADSACLYNVYAAHHPVIEVRLEGNQLVLQYYKHKLS